MGLFSRGDGRVNNLVVSVAKTQAHRIDLQPSPPLVFCRKPQRRPMTTSTANRRRSQALDKPADPIIDERIGNAIILAKNMRNNGASVAVIESRLVHRGLDKAAESTPLGTNRPC
jgi:hypothetical protein